MSAGIGIARDKQLVGDQLGRAVKIDRTARLVGRQRDDALNALVDASVDHVHRADDVGLHAFERIVFGGRHDLQSRGMNHVINAVEGAGLAVRDRARRR